MITIEPRSNGPAFKWIPPVTDTNSWTLQPIFFYFLCWLLENFIYNKMEFVGPLSGILL